MEERGSAAMIAGIDAGSENERYSTFVWIIAGFRMTGCF